jgi:hypothetical protein
MHPDGQTVAPGTPFSTPFIFLPTIAPLYTMAAYIPDYIQSMTKDEFKSRYAAFSAYEEKPDADATTLRRTMAELVVAAHHLYEDHTGNGDDLLDKIRAKLHLEDPELDVDVVRHSLQLYVIDLVTAITMLYTYEDLCIYGI